VDHGEGCARATVVCAAKNVAKSSPTLISLGNQSSIIRS
jgi:hypothetical protein